jgi:hypothetical protein
MPPTADLDAAEKATLAALLQQVIATDPFPMSPRIWTLRTILDKLEPQAPRPAPFPPPKPAGTPSAVLAKMRGARRRR